MEVIRQIQLTLPKMQHSPVSYLSKHPKMNAVSAVAAIRMQVKTIFLTLESTLKLILYLHTAKPVVVANRTLENKRQNYLRVLGT